MRGKGGGKRGRWEVSGTGERGGIKAGRWMGDAGENEDVWKRTRMFLYITVRFGIMEFIHKFNNRVLI